MYLRFSFQLLLLISLPYLSYADRLTAPLNTWASTYKVQKDQPAEVLERRVRVTINENMEKTTTVYSSIRINTKDAIDDYSQINIQFNDYFRRINLDFAQVLTKEGELVPVKEDAIQIKSTSSENFYVDSKVLAFSLPLTYAGSIIEFQYTTTHKNHEIEAEFFSTSSFSHWERKANQQGYRVDYVHFSEYTLEAPKEKHFSYDTLQKVPIKHTKKTTDTTTLHTWQAKNIPAVKFESYLPLELVLTPYIEISSVNTWQGISKWAHSVIKPTIESTEDTQKIAREIQAKTAEKSAQIQHVFSYMQNNIRYVFAHVGRGGYTPHLTSNIIANGYGDCKDQTVLAIALLKELGIKAYPALVATSYTSIPNQQIPQIAFDHMITYIPKQTGIEEMWMDTVGGTFLFPGMSNMINNRPALIVNENSTQLTTINNVQQKPNAIRLSAQVKKPEKGHLPLNFNLQFEGEIEATVRNWLRYAEDKNKAINSLLVNIYPNAEVKHYRINNEEDFFKEITIEGAITFPYQETNEENIPFSFGSNISRLASSFSLVPELEEPENRTHPIEINQQYALSIFTSIEKPTGYVLSKNSSADIKDNNSVFNYQHIINNNSNSIDTEQYLTLKTLGVSVDEYPYTYTKIDSIKDKAWGIQLTYNENKNTVNNLQNKIDTSDSAESYINLLQALIESGDYQKALENTEAAIIKYPDNGNIFYLQGLINAYLGNDKAADISFTKAEELGYDI